MRRLPIAGARAQANGRRRQMRRRSEPDAGCASLPLRESNFTLNRWRPKVNPARGKLHSEARSRDKNDSGRASGIEISGLPNNRLCRLGNPQAGTPIRLISHSSSTPEFSFTRRRTVSPSVSMSAAVALPRLIRKLQCSSDTCASPTISPRQPAASISCQALLSGRVLEGRAAGAALDRLRRLARLGDLVHLGRDRRAVAGRALRTAPA